MIRLFLLLSLLLAIPAGAQTITPAQYREDAQSIEALINETYAYPERLPGGRFTLTPKLREEAARVSDGRSLLRFAERALLLLADHHAITGSSFDDSYGLVPSFADLWIERAGNGFVIDAVRDNSPAASVGIGAGDRLVAIDGVPVAEAVAAFWHDLDADPAGRDAAFAARVLAAGRRDRPRRLTVQRGTAPPRAVELANLYTVQSARRPPVSAGEEGRALRIRINDSLGDDGTVAAFDAAMARPRPGQLVIVDLTDTPGGGNSSVARAILGWFVDRPRFFQMHNLPAEERETGIARQWVEQVLPRPGKYHRGPVRVEVGRWTGSMGEGLAIGFDAIGVPVFGTRMAGLRGAVYDRRLAHSGLVLKLPAERLSHVNGTPREAFVPRAGARR
jgi:carboxyl-terminal processing protease